MYAPNPSQQPDENGSNSTLTPLGNHSKTGESPEGEYTVSNTKPIHSDDLPIKIPTTKYSDIKW